MSTFVKMPTSKLTVCYAPVRGLGAPIKMACEYAGADYDVYTYEGVENKLEVDAWREGWWADKPALSEKNPLINIPYIIDGDVIVSQSNAVLQYLGRKYSLSGANPQEQLKVDQLLCEIIDLRNTVVGIAYGPKDTYEERAKSHMDEYYPGMLTKFDKWLKLYGTKYLASDAPTVADFSLWEMLDQHESWCKPLGKPQPLAAFPRLKEYHAAIRALPQLQKYFDGPNYAMAINAYRANFFKV